MTAPALVRTRSGLSMTLPADWAVVDAIEAHGPQGIVVSATSHPLLRGLLVDELAANDQLAGAVRVGAPAPVRLLGDVPGLVQRFESAADGHGFAQLAGYAVYAGRAYVIRATCLRTRFDELEPHMRSQLAGVTVESSGRFGRGMVRSARSTQFDAYLQGDQIAPLPPLGDTIDRNRMKAAWSSHRSPGDETHLATLTTWELDALVGSFGVPVFPAIGASPHQRATLTPAGRSALLARGFVRFSGANEFEMHDHARTIVELALQAQTLIQLSEHAAGAARSTTWFLTAAGALGVRGFAGDISVCSTVGLEDVFAHVWKAIDATEGDGPPTLDDGEMVSTPHRRLVLRAVTIEDGHVGGEDTTLAVVAGRGSYTRRPEGGAWRRTSLDDLRQHALDVVAP